MPLPDIQRAEKDLVDKVQVCAFMAQLELRKHLNTIHTELYQQGCQESTYDYLHIVIQFINRYVEADTSALDSVLLNLQSTIEKLNLCLGKIYRAHQPQETEPNSILATRGKVKFFAAMALTFRPYLMMILDREDLEVKISEKVGNYAKRCITALEQSAMASNSIKDNRLITHA